MIEKITDSRFPLQRTYLKSGKSVFESLHGWVFYEESIFHLVIAGEPVLKAGAQMSDLMSSFVDYSLLFDKRVCGYYLSASFFLPDFEKRKVGTSTIVDLKTFSLIGRQARDLRRALNHGLRGQLRFQEILTESDRGEFTQGVKELYESWIKTRRGPRVRFLLSPPNLQKSDRCFAVLDRDGEVAAFVSLFEYEDDGKSGYYIDDMIQGPQSHRFALDYLLVQIFIKLKSEKCYLFSLGLNAFDDVDRSNKFGRFLYFIDKLQWPYKSRGLLRFKGKFGKRKVARYLLKEKSDSFIGVVMSLAFVTYFSFDKYPGKLMSWARRRSKVHGQCLGHPKEKLMSS